VTERLPEPASPRTTYEPVGAGPDVAAKNVRLGLALFALALLIAGAAVAITFIYLEFD
jgi:hypothetical protein